jgi:hypothetical protein
MTLGQAAVEVKEFFETSVAKCFERQVLIGSGEARRRRAVNLFYQRKSALISG